MTPPAPILLRKQILLLPILSGCLLALTQYPFHFSFLIFIAFVPLFYFIHTSWQKVPEMFWGLFSFSFFLVLSISYFNLSGFLWAPEAHFFQTLMQFLPLPIALVSGGITGIIGVLGVKLVNFSKKLTSPSLHFLLFIFPIFLTLTEISITFFSKGYDFSILAYTLHTQSFFVSLASIGGIHFVSFVIFTINAIITTGFYIFFQQRDLPLRARLVSLIPLGAWTIGLSLLLGVATYGNSYYLHHDQETKSTTISILQNTDTFGGMFGTLDSEGVFRYETIENLIKEARKSNPDIIIYPYALADYVLRMGSTSTFSVDTAPIESIAKWTASTTPDTTLVTWDNILHDKKIYDEIHFWKEGALYSSYAKRIVFPFMDYTPLWAQKYGFYTTSLDLTPEPQMQPPTLLNEVRIGSVICSEIVERELVRENVSDTNILFSIGSNAMFITPMIDEFTLASTQFRAIENNRPVIRANRMGPSAIIDNRGTIISQMSPNQSGVLSHEITLEIQPRKTLYSLTGDWLILSMCIILLMLLFY